MSEKQVEILNIIRPKRSYVLESFKQTRLELECWELPREWAERQGNTRAVAQFTKQGKFLKLYSSMSVAMEETGVNVTNICAACQGRQRTAGRSVWRVVE